LIIVILLSDCLGTRPGLSHTGRLVPLSAATVAGRPGQPAPQNAICG
jgi:hypothetical protein